MLERICNALSLGEMTTPPVPLSGGYTHRMFRVTTAQGDYAVKLLNPEVMVRPDALDNYRAAETGESLLEAAVLPILPAKVIGGRKLQLVDGQYLYVFDYFAGRVLKEEEITPAHCGKIGAVLAQIHGIDRRRPSQSSGGDSAPGGIAFWQGLAQQLLSSADAREEGALLQAAVPMLERAAAAAQEALCRLPQTETLCHNDMDPKNVLWRGEDFRIIDLECVGYANPAQEMLDLAISWGDTEEKFKAFVDAYFAAGGLPISDAAAVYDSRRNYIDWLAYNARRALADDTEERCIARQQINMTIAKIRGDTQMRETILRWLQEIEKAHDDRVHGNQGVRSMAENISATSDLI